MIEGYGAVTQALLGTLLTWGLTAAGAGCVFFIRGKHVSYHGEHIKHFSFNGGNILVIFVVILCYKPCFFLL